VLPVVVEVEVDDPETDVDVDIVNADIVDLDLVVVVADFVTDVLFGVELDVSGPPSSEPGLVAFLYFQYCSSR
jgi:hypothetical protein